MTSVWLVETGEYSDYRVVGVFSTREKAERYRLALALDDEPREVTLDPDDERWREGLQPFHLNINEDGAITVSWRLEYWDVEQIPVAGVWSLAKADGGGTSRLMLDGKFWARSRESANKIIADRQKQLRASGEWTTRGDFYRPLPG